MANVIAWNTGRTYSAEGQRLAATVVGDVCYFVDIDRGISGQFYTIDNNPSRSEVMSMYDAGAYQDYDYSQPDIMNALRIAAES